MTDWQAKFEAYHKSNPHVYDRLCELAREWMAAGNDKVGIRMLFELIRWDHGIKTSGRPYKINENFTSRYARLIQAQEVDLKDLFRLRVLRS